MYMCIYTIYVIYYFYVYYLTQRPSAFSIQSDLSIHLFIHPSMHPSFLFSANNQVLSPYPVLGTALGTEDINNPKDRQY